MKVASRTMNLGSAIVLTCALALVAGCRAIPAPLPDAVPDLTLGTLQQIQTDQTLTPDQRRAILRSLLGVEDDVEGNRLVNFVLGIQVPQQ